MFCTVTILTKTYSSNQSDNNCVFQVIFCQKINETTDGVEYSISSSISTSSEHTHKGRIEDSDSSASELETSNHTREALTQEGNAPEVS